MIQKNKNSAKYPIDSILKAAAVIETLSESPEEMGVTELSQSVGLGISTTHRILDTLVSVGYVQRNNTTHRYRLGIGLFHIGCRLINQYALHPEVEGWLKELTRQTGETSKMGALVNGKMVYLSVVESSSSLRFVSKIGDWAPVHCTAMGKVLLAFLTEEEINRILESIAPLQQMTQRTLNESEIRAHLKNIRQTGFAIDDEEFVIGSRGIAVPISNGAAIPRVSLSISGPSVRLSKEKLLEHLPALQEIAGRLSEVVLY